MRTNKPVFYILKDKQPVPVYDISQLSSMSDESNWRVDSSSFHGYWVSTVFLGIDHNFGNTSIPILFETMLFDKNGDSISMKRCATWDEATEQHKSMLYELSVELDIDFNHFATKLKEKLATLSNGSIQSEKTTFSNSEEFIADLLLKMQ